MDCKRHDGGRRDGRSIASNSRRVGPRREGRAEGRTSGPRRQKGLRAAFSDVARSPITTAKGLATSGGGVAVGGNIRGCGCISRHESSDVALTIALGIRWVNERPRESMCMTQARRGTLCSPLATLNVNLKTRARPNASVVLAPRKSCAGASRGTQLTCAPTSDNCRSGQPQLTQLRHRNHHRVGPGDYRDN